MQQKFPCDYGRPCASCSKDGKTCAYGAERYSETPWSGLSSPELDPPALEPQDESESSERTPTKTSKRQSVPPGLRGPAFNCDHCTFDFSGSHHSVRKDPISGRRICVRCYSYHMRDETRRIRPASAEFTYRSAHPWDASIAPDDKNPDVVKAFLDALDEEDAGSSSDVEMITNAGEEPAQPVHEDDLESDGSDQEFRPDTAQSQEIPDSDADDDLDTISHLVPRRSSRSRRSSASDLSTLPENQVR